MVLTARTTPISPLYGIQYLCGSLIDNNKIYLTETERTPGNLFLGYMLVGAATGSSSGGTGGGGSGGGSGGGGGGGGTFFPFPVPKPRPGTRPVGGGGKSLLT